VVAAGAVTVTRIEAVQRLNGPPTGAIRRTIAPGDRLRLSRKDTGMASTRTRTAPPMFAQLNRVRPPLDYVLRSPEAGAAAIV
jgi:hypothetical protein